MCSSFITWCTTGGTNSFGSLKKTKKNKKTFLFFFFPVLSKSSWTVTPKTKARTAPWQPPGVSCMSKRLITNLCSVCKPSRINNLVSGINKSLKSLFETLFALVISQLERCWEGNNCPWVILAETLQPSSANRQNCESETSRLCCQPTGKITV